MADRGSMSGKLPTSTMSTGKRMKQGSDTKRGFTRISTCSVVLFLQSGGDLPDGPTHVFKNSYWRYSLFI